MDNVMIRVDEKTIKKMLKYYDSQMVDTNDSHVIFKAQVIGCSITALLSNEVYFEGIRAKETAEIWQKKPKTTKKVIQSEETSGLFLESHIGSDDVGNTDYFGPICTVACFVEKRYQVAINSNHIRC